MNSLKFMALRPEQSSNQDVFCFVATAAQLERFAKIERAGRDENGALSGFQRPQIASHIQNIADYLAKPTAILPNALVVGFPAESAKFTLGRDGTGELRVDVSKGPPGWIVDGQQRFTALAKAERPDFQVIVSGFISPNSEELQRQFILINSARPLPKALVYELLPQVSDLPPSLSQRAQAARVTEALNFGKRSSLRGLIKQQTNPTGCISDTVIQKVVLNSMSDGALRLYVDRRDVLAERGAELLSEYFHAVRQVFREDWEGHTAKTSRLLHGAGIVSMGYVMEAIHSATGASCQDDFVDGLSQLVGKTAWTSGQWDFDGETRPWNSIQYVPRDVRVLSMHLIRLLRRNQRRSGRHV